MTFQKLFNKMLTKCQIWVKTSLINDNITNKFPARKAQHCTDKLLKARLASDRYTVITLRNWARAASRHHRSWFDNEKFLWL